MHRINPHVNNACIYDTNHQHNSNYIHNIVFLGEKKKKKSWKHWKKSWTFLYLFHLFRNCTSPSAVLETVICYACPQEWMSYSALVRPHLEYHVRALQCETNLNILDRIQWAVTRMNKRQDHLFYKERLSLENGKFSEGLNVYKYLKGGSKDGTRLFSVVFSDWKSSNGHRLETRVVLSDH